MKKFVLFCLLVTVTFGYADDSKISPELRGYNSTQPVQVIVQYAPGTQPAAQPNCGGLLGLVNCVVSDLLNIVGQLPLINGVVALVDGTGIVNLSNQSNVVYISSDRQLSTLDVAGPAVNAEVAWQSNYIGTGIGVALIDSGVNSHPDLYTGILPISRVVYNQSFISGTSSTNDQYGHGTHIAGLIAGDGLASTGLAYSQTFKGIAPGAEIVNLRVLDANGEATDSEVIAAINQAISLKSRYNIRVMNLSLGRAVYESYKLDPLCQAVEKAWQNGIVVVVAAGNNGRFQPTDGYATVTSPGNDPYVITVGAMKPMGTPTRVDDQIASYSSKGPTVVDAFVKPDLVAPGNMLTSLEAQNSTLYNELPGNQVPFSYYVKSGSSAISSTYFTLSGTSMATGIVSGVVADLLQKSPRLTPDQVKARLMLTAYKTFPQFSSTTDPTTGITYTDQYDVFTIGAGYVDAESALSSNAVAQGTAMSPVTTFNSTTDQVTMTADPSAVWNTSSTWSYPEVWGASQFVKGTTATSSGATASLNSSVAGNEALW